MKTDNTVEAEGGAGLCDSSERVLRGGAGRFGPRANSSPRGLLVGAPWTSLPGPQGPPWDSTSSLVSRPPRRGLSGIEGYGQALSGERWPERGPEQAAGLGPHPWLGLTLCLAEWKKTCFVSCLRSPCMPSPHLCLEGEALGVSLSPSHTHSS